MVFDNSPSEPASRRQASGAARDAGVLTSESSPLDPKIAPVFRKSQLMCSGGTEMVVEAGPPLPRDLVSHEVAAEQVGAHPQTFLTISTFPVCYPVLARQRARDGKPTPNAHTYDFRSS